MDETTRKLFGDLRRTDYQVRYITFLNILAETDKPVDWAYEVWDWLVAELKSEDNHQRAIAAQILGNLAKSDPQKRVLKDFDKLLAVTSDERFVTARHSLQAIWKVGAAGKEQRQMLVDALSSRFQDCASEKHYTLIRYDILQGFRNLYDAVGDESLKMKAQALIETEADPKYRQKYRRVWNGS